jgi:succinate dehydrogenase flavin-adding protein (antitoxin of CptAB toxin-antitoxin module)
MQMNEVLKKENQKLLSLIDGNKQEQDDLQAKLIEQLQTEI